MPFREKAKALFRPKKGGTDSPKSSNSRQESSVYYKPHEMPRPKYRAAPTKEHKEKLESFSFTEAWRRKSFQSQYSPMGTRAPSRRGSFMSLARRRSVRSHGGRSNLSSRNNSISSESGPMKEGVRHRETYGAAFPTRLSTEIEADGDDDVTNVGISRLQSRERAPQTKDFVQAHKPTEPSKLATASRPGSPPNESSKANDSGAYLVDNTAHDHQMFSERDLALALHRSHLAVPAN